jgi:hypothetical protein
MGGPLPSGQLVSRVGNGDVPGLEEEDCKGHVTPWQRRAKKEISYLFFPTPNAIRRLFIFTSRL